MARKYIKTGLPRRAGSPHRKYKHSREAPDEFARKVKCGVADCPVRFFTKTGRDEHRRLFHRPKDSFWGESLQCLTT